MLWISLWKKWDQADRHRINITFLLNWLQNKREINMNVFNKLYCNHGVNRDLCVAAYTEVLDSVGPCV